MPTNCGIVTLLNLVMNYVEVRINGGVQSNNFELTPATCTLPSYVSVPDGQGIDLDQIQITPCVPASAFVVRNAEPSGVPGEFCEQNTVEIMIEGRKETYNIPIQLVSHPLVLSLNLLVLRSGLVLLEDNGNIIWSEFRNQT